MTNPRLARALAAALLPFLAGCTFHSTAVQWNGRLGPDGKPVHVLTTTKYGLNLVVLLPFFGDTRTAQVVDEATARIAESGSDRLRVVETESANYWFALPPLSWFVSPVMGSVSIEYTPSTQALQQVAATQQLQDTRAAERREQDHGHVIPEARRN
jgi:hypothetical protein